jgi:hypothetical protein
VVAQSKAWTVYSLDRGDCVLESQSKHGYLYGRVYSVFVLPCVQVAAVQQEDHSCKELYRLCKIISTPKREQKCCKAIDEWINNYVV